MLAAIGEAPVDSVDTATQPDVGIALGILKETMREFLSEGWRFNTRFGVEVSPNGTFVEDGITYNIFPVPANVVRFDAGGAVGTTVTSTDELVFYDTYNDREGFESDTLKLTRAVYFRGWGHLPETAKQYVLKVSTNEFIQRVVGSETLASFAERDILKTLRSLVRDQGIRDRFNLFRGLDYSEFMGGRA